MNLKVGLIGLGKMGALHLAQLLTIENVSIAGVVDRDMNLLKYFSKVNPTIPTFSEVEVMLDSAKPDAVYICTPSFTHLPIASICSRYGTHQFVEKPLAESFDSAQKMVEQTKGRNFIYATGYSFAFHPVFRKAKQLLTQNILGKIPRFRSATYISVVSKKEAGWIYEKDKSGGGVVINSGSHLLHLLYWYFGDVKRLYANTQRIYSSVEDSAFIFLEFNSNTVGIVDISWSMPGYRLQEIRITAEGENGCMEIDNDEIKVYLKKSQGGLPEGWTSIHKMDISEYASEFFLGSDEFNSEDKHFVECCLENKTPIVSWNDAVKVQQIIERVYQSAKEGRIVEVKNGRTA